MESKSRQVLRQYQRHAMKMVVTDADGIPVRRQCRPGSVPINHPSSVVKYKRRSGLTKRPGKKYPFSSTRQHERYARQTT